MLTIQHTTTLHKSFLTLPWYKENSVLIAKNTENIVQRTTVSLTGCSKSLSRVQANRTVLYIQIKSNLQYKHIKGPIYTRTQGSGDKNTLSCGYILFVILLKITRGEPPKIDT